MNTKTMILPREVKEIHPISNKVMKSIVMVNVRECGLDYMFHKRYITEEQHLAGIKFRQHFERSMIGGYKGINFNAIISNKTPRSYSLPDRVCHALDELLYAHKCLGELGYKIAVFICGQDYSLMQTRQILNIKKTYMGERLREVLTDLANIYGFK